MDFEKKYDERSNGMVFAPYQTEIVKRCARTDALNVLADAHARTIDEDMRTDEVQAALEYLGQCVVRDAPFTLFWDGLFFENQAIRWETLDRALSAIKREIGMTDHVFQEIPF